MTLAPPKPSPLRPGFRLGRYELLCPIAQGGMAMIWLARLRGANGLDELVAVKTILPEHATELRFQRMFLDEARLASAIVHPNVGRILELGEDREVLFLVMEWIDGDALSKIHRAMERRNQTLPIGVIVRVMADVCAGLHAAHDHVVHRDVSPHNILITARGEAKLIDFGIAKARDRLAAEANPGLVNGKIQFMAPEQATGRAIDRRADLFSVGACLYYLLSNRPPYDGPNPLATFHVLTSGRAPLSLPDRVPGPVAGVVMQALAFHEDDRFATAEELQGALEHAMHAAECWTTTLDVAAFMQSNFAKRIADRKKAIEVALDATGDRTKLALLLRPSTGESPGVLADTVVPPKAANK